MYLCYCESDERDERNTKKKSILNTNKQLQLDKEKLRKFGYLQELNRSIGVFSNFALSFSVISILTGLIILYGNSSAFTGIYALKSWILVGVFQLFMALCLGEISSCYPIAGGVYKWTCILANNAIGWFNGWISLIGWLFCVAGINYGLSKFILELFTGVAPNVIKLNFTFIIIVVLQTLLSTFGIKFITKINNLSVIVNICGAFIITILLLIFTKANNNWIHLSIMVNTVNIPWKSYVPCLLMTAWTLTAFDSSASISEETINPVKTVAYGMILSVVVSFILGLMLLFSIGQAGSSIIINNPTNESIALYIINTVLGSIVTKFVCFIAIIAMFICGLACQTVIVRIVYALSRDNGMPFSIIWKNVSESYETPLFSNTLCGILEIIICVTISIIEYILNKNLTVQAIPNETLSIITSLSTVGIYLSYAIVTFCSLVNRCKIKKDHGEFSLGKSGNIINLFSFIWAVFIALIILFYSNSLITKIFTGFIFFLIIYYLLSAKKDIANRRTLSERELIIIENMRRSGEDGE